MQKKILLLGFLLLTSSFTVISCAEDDGFGVEQTNNSVVSLTLTGSNISEYKTITIQATEINTGSIVTQTVENTNTILLDLPKGSYKIVVNGDVISRENEKITVASTTRLDVVNRVENFSIQLYAKQFSDDFILEEIFFAGVQTPEGKAYNSSRYFKLTNNTDKVLYADGVIIGQSEFLTSVNNNVTPYDKESYFPIKGMMVLPGSGTEYPVQPGDFIVIADNAINHHANNTNAFDLSNANFEFPNNNPAQGNVDNPAVPNVDVVFTTYNFNMIFLNNSGVEAYVLARFPEGEDRTTFIANYKYDYSFTNATGKVTSKSVYKIPNTWIVDGVNTASPDKLLHLLTSSSIDGGSTGVGSSYQNTDRYGKSIRRVVIGQSVDGKNVYKDTNDSSVDFIKNAEPSLKNGIVH